MNINKKIITIAIIFLFIFCMYSTFSIVAAKDSSPTDALFSNDKLKEVTEGITGDSNKGIVGGINTIIGLMQIVGTGISLIMITFLGIKYIIASVEEKAEIKKAAMPVLIGAILLFSAVNLIAVIENFTKDVIN